MNQEQILKKFGRSDYQVDEDSFDMGTNYLVADYIAQRFKGFGTALDSCCGAGFMSIALAKYADKIIAVDINPKNLEQAKFNVKTAGVFNKCEFILGDILAKETLEKMPKLDAAFLDPDWKEVGEISDRVHSSKLSDMRPPGAKLLKEIRNLTPNIAFKAPKEINFADFADFPDYELEKIYLDGSLKFFCIYFGKLAGVAGGEKESRIVSSSARSF